MVKNCDQIERDDREMGFEMGNCDVGYDQSAKCFDYAKVSTLGISLTIYGNILWSNLSVSEFRPKLVTFKW